MPNPVGKVSSAIFNKRHQAVNGLGLAILLTGQSLSPLVIMRLAILYSLKERRLGEARFFSFQLGLFSFNPSF
jgi:hypothetical protein